jgi:hypothetical protein
VILGAVAVGLIILQQFWKWEVERIEVPPGKVVVKIQRWGKDLPEDEIVKPDESYKGVMVEPLSEGRWFLNPIFWAYKVHDIVKVPPGECLVLTRKFGKPIPSERLAEGDILAREGERGILAETLTPGNYRLNPYAYDWQLVKAVDVGVNQVGVRILKMGKDPRTRPPDRKRSPYVVSRGYRGVQEVVEQKGTYCLNPYVETIVPVERRQMDSDLRGYRTTAQKPSAVRRITQQSRRAGSQQLPALLQSFGFPSLRQLVGRATKVQNQKGGR